MKFNIYKKEIRIEREIEINFKQANIFNASVLFLAQFANSKINFNDLFSNEVWSKFTSQMFSLTLMNLLLSGKIKGSYFADKKTLLLDLYTFQSDGYYIYLPAETTIDENDDLLAVHFLTVLNKNKHYGKITLSSLIEQVINVYLLENELSKPEKKFCYYYLIEYAKKETWFKIIKIYTYWGFSFNFKVEAEEQKLQELKQLKSKLNDLIFEEKRRNILFRNFIEYANETIKNQFVMKYPRG